MARGSDRRTTAELRPRQALTARTSPAGRAAALGLITVCLGLSIIQLDVTIVNVALPAIQRDLGGSLAGLQWVVDAYTLGLAAVMLTAGSEADRSGARRLFTAGLIVFGVGSAACAAAPTLGVLIAARAFQGLGASALLPCSLALLVHQFPDPRSRAHAIGVWGAMGAIGVALGPVLGGVLVAVATWRLIFVINVPVCALTIWLLHRYVAESPRNSSRQIDLWGLLLGVGALTGLTAGFITAGQQGWLAPVPLALLATGAGIAVLFVLAERRQQAPMLPLRLFRSRNLSVATSVGVLFNLCLYGTMICLSLFLQQERHESALSTGLLILPMSVALGAGSLASGPLIARLGPKPPMIAGLAVAAAGATLLAFAGTGTPLALIVAGSVLVALCAPAMPAMTAVVVGSAGRQHAGLASGILNAARQSGGAMGVALLGALLAASQRSGHAGTLHAPFTVAALAYLAAIGLTAAIRPERSRPG